METHAREFIVRDAHPVRFAPTQSSGPLPYPDMFQTKVVVTTVHDGAFIPPQFMESADPDLVQQFYEIERDWGACMVADAMAEALQLPGAHHVDLARALLDFGRFPGSTVRNADHTNRFAINFPFSGFLNWEQKKHLLEDYYDSISNHMDEVTKNCLMAISVHTYDTNNASGTRRPPVSLVSRAAHYQKNAEMAVGVFDPLYPDVLGEFTADRILRDRISLNLEKEGIAVAHNFPYALPEGSLEVRSQVWFFFAYLRREFEAAHPDSREDPSYAGVWDMLMDTNLRSSQSEVLRSTLHLFRRAPPGQESHFAACRRAYEAVQSFLHQNQDGIVAAYRRSNARPSSLGIEVRKDLVWAMDSEGRPLRPRPEAARHIGQRIAAAIAQYLCEDHRPS